MFDFDYAFGLLRLRFGGFGWFCCFGVWCSGAGCGS